MKQQDYLSTESYLNQPLNPNFIGFSSFFDVSTSLHFFSLLDAQGNVLLMSEGYPEEKSLHNGIQAVLKNLNNPKRYKIIALQDTFYISLKAGNHKEIARSIPFNDLDAAQEHLNLLTVYTPVAVTQSIDPTAETTNFDFYLGHSRIWDDAYGYTGYAKFTYEGNAYFVVYNDDQSVYLRSKPFATEAERDQQFNELRHHIVRDSAYEVKEEGQNYFSVLYDYHKNEIARSLPYNAFLLAHIATPAGRVKERAGGLF